MLILEGVVNIVLATPTEQKVKKKNYASHFLLCLERIYKSASQFRLKPQRVT